VKTGCLGAYSHRWDVFWSGEELLPSQLYPSQDSEDRRHLDQKYRSGDKSADSQQEFHALKGHSAKLSFRRYFSDQFLSLLQDFELVGLKSRQSSRARMTL
jgi:hypothetical protein